MNIMSNYRYNRYN